MTEPMSPLAFDLFGELLEESWKKEWQDMPEFVQHDLEPEYQITVSFESLEDVVEFGKLFGKNYTKDTRSMWFPDAEIGRYANKRYVDEEVV